MTAEFPFNAGDTFDPVLTWTDDSGAPVDLTGVTIECHLRDGAGELAPGLPSTGLVVNTLDQLTDTGKFRLVAAFAVTALWPQGTLFGNVRMTFPVGPTRRSTATFLVKVLTPPTRGP